MVKKVEVEEKEVEDSSEYDDEDLDSDEEKVDENASVDSDVMIAARDAAENEDNPDHAVIEKFGMKAINDEEGMLERLKEVQ